MNEADLNRRIDAIVTDRNHGASELARQALNIANDASRKACAADAGELHGKLRTLARTLVESRPSMAPIVNLVGRWEAELDGLQIGDIDVLRQQAGDAAQRLSMASFKAVSDIGAHACGLIQDGQTIVTHSLSSTVVEALRRLAGRDVRVIVSESRPLCEGYRVAERLSQWRIHTTLITDAQLGLAAQEADVAIVGADSVLADGTLINKVGTYLLALAARDTGVPLYVCCESFKRLPASRAVRLEEMAPSEIGAPILPNVAVRNVYFDRTPPHLVSGWIDERGVHYHHADTA